MTIFDRARQLAQERRIGFHEALAVLGRRGARARVQRRRAQIRPATRPDCVADLERRKLF